MILKLIFIISISCLISYLLAWFLFKSKNNKQTKINDPIKTAFNKKNIANLINVSKNESNSVGFRVKKTAVDTIITKEHNGMLREAINKYLYDSSILRSCFTSSKINLEESGSINVKHTDNYIYKEGTVYTYSLSKGTSYRLPITEHFYSQEVAYSPELNNLYNVNTIYAAGLEIGEHLAALENKLLITTLLYHNKTRILHNIVDSVSAYRACLDFKEKQVCKYILLIPYSDPYQIKDLELELKSNLKYPVDIYIQKVTSFTFNSLQLSAILIEKTDDLNINLVQRGDLSTTIVKHNNQTTPYLELLTSYGIVFSGLNNVTLCFKSNTMCNEILNIND